MSRTGRPLVWVMFAAATPFVCCFSWVFAFWNPWSVVGTGVVAAVVSVALAVWAHSKERTDIRAYGIAGFNYSLMIFATGIVMAPGPDAPAEDASMADAVSRGLSVPDEPDLRTVGSRPAEAILYTEARPVPGEPPDAFRTPPWFAPDVDPRSLEMEALDLYVRARLLDSPAFREAYLAALRDTATTREQRRRLLSAVGGPASCEWFLAQQFDRLPDDVMAIPSARTDCEPPEAPTVPALSTCALSAANYYSRQGCFEELIRVDRASAVRLVPRLRADPNGYVRTETLDALERMPSLDPLIAQATALGAPGNGVQPETPSLDLVDVLEANGRALRFDTETGTFPNHHDALLYDVARLTGDVLAGATFIETAPAVDTREPYSLSAFLGGRVWTVSAENQGDWYDVEAVVGLTNTMLRDANSDVRVFFMDPGDQTTILVAGPEAVIRAAAARGELEIIGLPSGAAP